VPPGDPLDGADRDERLDLVGDPGRSGPAVDRDQPQLPAEHAAVLVDLLRGELRAELTGRAEHSGRPLQRDHQRDVYRVVKPDQARGAALQPGGCPGDHRTG
jgi:hypothetical protein